MTQEEMFKQMSRENPEVLLFVDDLDLRDPQTGLSPVVSEAPATERERLSNIALRVLSRGRVYSPDQVVSLMSEGLRISRQRAEKGFEMMMSSGVLSGSSISGIRVTM